MAKEATQVQSEDLKAKAENPRIKNDFMSVTYVRPHFDIDKGKRSVGMEFSLELSEGHETMLPDGVVREWRHLAKGACDLIKIDDAGVQRFVQRFVLQLVPDNSIVGIATSAPMTDIKLQVIEDKGTGAARDVVRLSFRLVCDLTEQTEDVERFACRQFDNIVWLKLTSLQGEIFS